VPTVLLVFPVRTALMARKVFLARMAPMALPAFPARTALMAFLVPMVSRALMVPKVFLA
jgi:hypothetical protein